MYHHLSVLVMMGSHYGLISQHYVINKHGTLRRVLCGLIHNNGAQFIYLTVI